MLGLYGCKQQKPTSNSTKRGGKWNLETLGTGEPEVGDFRHGEIKRFKYDCGTLPLLSQVAVATVYFDYTALCGGAARLFCPREPSLPGPTHIHTDPGHESNSHSSVLRLLS